MLLHNLMLMHNFFLVYVYTCIHVLRVRFCPVPGPCVGRKTRKTPGMCVHKASAHQKLRYHAHTINNIYEHNIIMSRPKASHTLTFARA